MDRDVSVDAGPSCRVRIRINHPTEPDEIIVQVLRDQTGGA